MPSRKSMGASKAARLFVVVVCVVIIVLELLSALRDREAALRQAVQATSNMALALSQHADQTFDAVDIVLRGTLEHLKKDGRSMAGKARTHEYLIENVRTLPQLAGLFVYDEDGHWIASSQLDQQQGLNNISHDYFSFHRDSRSDVPFIGRPIQNKSTGQWVLTISRRIEKPDGSFGGVVLGTLNLAFFEHFYEQFHIGKSGAIMFGVNDGTVLQRRPRLSDSIGKVLSNSPLFQQHVKLKQSGSVEIPSTQDGVLRINSFTHLENYPLFIIVAVSRNDVLDRWYRELGVSILGVSFLLAVLFYGGAKMARQVSLREQAEESAIESREKLSLLYQTLHAQSQRDGLTEVYNRRYFDSMLAAELARFQRSGGALSLVMLDVDHFKQYNDTYGHVDGDTCLQKIAGAVAMSTHRKGDVVARYGGEEFALILPDSDQSGGQALAHQMLAAVRALAIPHESSAIGTVSISIGVVSVKAEAGFNIAPRDFIAIADEALYAAKNQGRDQAVCRDFLGQKAAKLALGALREERKAPATATATPQE